MSVRFLIYVLSILNALQAVTQENGVHFLNDKTFSDFISKNQEVLVIFTNEWCVFCKQFYSEAVKLGLRTQRVDMSLKIALINTDENPQTVNVYGVNEYPTILFFVGGESFKYQGHRNEQDIYLWTQRITNTKDKELQLNQLRILYDMKLAVLFLYPKEYSTAFKKFRKLQLDNPNTPFFHSTNEEVKKKLKLEKKFNLIIFKNFNGGDQDLLDSDDLFTLGVMQDFVNSYSKLSVDYLDEEFVNKIFVEKESGMIVFTDGMDEELNPEMIIYRDFTRKNLNKFNFGYAKWNKGMGLKKQEVPVGVIVDYKNDQLRKFKISSIDQQTLQQSLEDYKLDKLVPYKLNKDIQQQLYDVKELDSQQLNQEVLNNEKASFVLIFDEETKEEIIQSFIQSSQEYNQYEYYLYDGAKNENDQIKIKRIPDILFVNEKLQLYYGQDFHKHSINDFIKKQNQKLGGVSKLSEEL